MTAGTVVTSPVQPATARRRRRWIDDWDPEDRAQWRTGGALIAGRNLVMSIFTEHIGFSVWSLWSVFVLFLTPKYGLSTLATVAASQKFLLTTLPTAIGAASRLPYTLAVARFGGRNWTIASALLLLIPTVATAVLLRPGTNYGELLLLACLAGVGGGNFASSMTNINAFYPQRLKGMALGLNAGGGNVGVAVVQLVGLAVLATAGKDHPRLLLAIYIPLIVLCALGAALSMDNLSQVRNEKRALREVCGSRHTWLISFLYIGTFGSFIGFGFAFGQVLSIQFPSHFSNVVHGRHVVDPVKVAYLTFLGPLVGSLVRPLGGWLADRVGGARTTLVNFALMAGAAGLVLEASVKRSLPMFLLGFLLLFVLSGIGNGSTYKMIPAIFRAEAEQRIASGVDTNEARDDARRLTGALIGVAGAIGAFGGVFVNIAFRQSFLADHNGNGAYVAFIAFYLICLAITWLGYVRAAARQKGRV